MATFDEKLNKMILVQGVDAYTEILQNHIECDAILVFLPGYVSDIRKEVSLAKVKEGAGKPSKIKSYMFFSHAKKRQQEKETITTHQEKLQNGHKCEICGSPLVYDEDYSDTNSHWVCPKCD